jgi:adenine-specific DNA-methyltransferase
MSNTNPKYQELVTKLREIFQIDRPELDFGIYRILNARATEINEYLSNRLSEKVKESLTSGASSNLQQLKLDLAEGEKQAAGLGVDPSTLPKLNEIREKIAQYGDGSQEYENQVFSHLLTFFSRYYEQGDFISQRRYKGDTYAIPYAGEEVMLHWANKDQYYTKSGEAFSNFTFKLDDGRSVHFRLTAADTAKDNRKDNDKDRRYCLLEQRTITKLDEDGDEYEEVLLPIEEIPAIMAEVEEGSEAEARLIKPAELLIRFEYKAFETGTKQDSLIEAAVAKVLADPLVKKEWTNLESLASTEKNPKRTLLEKHLINYTTKNTADYFIHKDLGGFLKRELDFYIKNEVLHLDDVQNAEKFSDIEKSLRMIQCLRSIAKDIIEFLASLENFQKKLWLKKKFVVSSNYCITLDRIPEELYPEIAANEKQWDQWRSLAVWDKKNNGNVDDIKAGLFRQVDTSLYDLDFKFKVISSQEKLDEKTNGLLIHSDNFQALNLIQAKYKEKIRCIYIDPPYNTAASEIIYKNEFKDSSWISLIENRLELGYKLASQDAIFSTAIDYAELFNLGKLKDSIFGLDHRIAILTIQHNPKGRNQAEFFSENCEYLLVYSKNVNKSKFNEVAIDEEVIATFVCQDEIGKYRWENYIRARTSWSRSKRPGNWYPIYVSSDLQEITSDKKEGYSEHYPITPSGDFSWKNIKETFDELNKNGYFKAVRENGEIVINHKYREQQVLKNVWIQKKYQSEFNGTNLLKDMLGDVLFDYPKSLYAVLDYIKITANKNDYVLDYFAGSGTTGHAVIQLNRQERSNRKYILIEQGGYFELVTKPRIIKSIYSSDWKKGKPVGSGSGVSHCFKMLKLQSYEDVLNNLELKRTPEQIDLLSQLPQVAKDDYLMHYMLDLESKGSILSVENFKKPFEFKLKIAVDSSGAYEETPVDLVETFNYLIGLTVKHIDADINRGFVYVTGTLPSGESCLVLWRDCDKLDYEGLSKLCNTLKINPGDSEYDVVYINGDHNIPSVLQASEADGGATKTLKLRPIEPEFLSLMFDVEDV